MRVFTSSGIHWTNRCVCVCVLLYNLFFSHTDLVPVAGPGSKDLVTTPIIGLRSLNNNTIRPLVCLHSLAPCLSSSQRNNQPGDEPRDERVSPECHVRARVVPPAGSMRVSEVVRNGERVSSYSWLTYGSLPHSARLLTLDTAWANQQVWHVTALTGTDQSLSHWEVYKQPAGLLLGALLDLFKSDVRCHSEEQCMRAATLQKVAEAANESTEGKFKSQLVDKSKEEELQTLAGYGM